MENAFIQRDLGTKQVNDLRQREDTERKVKGEEMFQLPGRLYTVWEAESEFHSRSHTRNMTWLTNTISRATVRHLIPVVLIVSIVNCTVLQSEINTLDRAFSPLASSSNASCQVENTEPTRANTRQVNNLTLK